MNTEDMKEEYRRQRSKLHFSEDFEENAARIMREAAAKTPERNATLQDGENSLQNKTNTLLTAVKALFTMHRGNGSGARRPLRIAVVAAAAVVLLTGTVFAAGGIASRLAAKDAAKHAAEHAAAENADPVLCSVLEKVAGAFASDEAEVIDESVESNGWRITLLGKTRGDDFFGELELDPAVLEAAGVGADESAEITFDPYMNVDSGAKHLFVAAAIERTDGSPVDEHDEMPMLTVTIDGFSPLKVNSWTLGFSAYAFVEDGVGYWLFDFDKIEAFAAHTIRLAAYDGVTPPNGTVDPSAADDGSGEIPVVIMVDSEMVRIPDESVFAQNADGSVAYADGYTGTRATFILPADLAKADPAAEDIARFYESTEVHYAFANGSN